MEQERHKCAHDNFQGALHDGFLLRRKRCEVDYKLPQTREVAPNERGTGGEVLRKHRNTMHAVSRCCSHTAIICWEATLQLIGLHERRQRPQEQLYALP